MTLLSLIGHQAKVTNCIRSRFCKYKPGCGVSHNSNHRAAELVTRAIPQLSQETAHFCRSVNKSCEDCPVWAAAANKLTRLEETQHFCGWGQKKVAKIVQCGDSSSHPLLLDCYGDVLLTVLVDRCWQFAYRSLDVPHWTPKEK